MTAGRKIFRFGTCPDCCGEPESVGCGYFVDNFTRSTIGPDWTVDSGVWAIAVTRDQENNIISGKLETGQGKATIVPNATPQTALLGVVVSVELTIASVGDQARVYVNYGDTAGAWYVQVERTSDGFNPLYTVAIFDGDDTLVSSILPFTTIGIITYDVLLTVCFSSVRIATKITHGVTNFSGPSYNTDVLSTNEVAIGTGNVPGNLRFDNVSLSHHQTIVPLDDTCIKCRDCLSCKYKTPDTIMVTLPELPENPFAPCGNCADYAGDYILQRVELDSDGDEAPWTGRSCVYQYVFDPPGPCGRVNNGLNDSISQFLRVNIRQAIFADQLFPDTQYVVSCRILSIVDGLFGKTDVVHQQWRRQMRTSDSPLVVCEDLNVPFSVPAYTIDFPHNWITTHQCVEQGPGVHQRPTYPPVEITYIN